MLKDISEIKKQPALAPRAGAWPATPPKRCVRSHSRTSVCQIIGGLTRIYGWPRGGSRGTSASNSNGLQSSSLMRMISRTALQPR